MRKGYITTAVGIVSAGLVASYLLSDREKRNKLKAKVGDYKRSLSRGNKYEHYSRLEDAGIPDQVDNFDLAQIENAKMVSEGSQYGVNYYNEVQEEENKKAEH